MESNFTSPVHWENEGVEPSTTLKKTGFQGGYKPPASVFNYFFYNNEKCIKELQTAANNLDANKSNLGHTHKYAASDSAGGAALSSRKLETARKINGVSFDGTQDITIDVTGKTRRYELGPYDSISRYSMFARTSNINTLENCGATLLVTDAGNFGSPQTGAWLIQLSNRESKPTMSVTTLLPHKKGTVNFGYYEDSENGYFYFGAYTGTYRSVFAVTVLRGTNVTLSDFGDTADAPGGWTTVTPRILQDNTDLQSYLPLTGGTLTGDLIVPHIKQSQSGTLLAENSTSENSLTVTNAEIAKYSQVYMAASWTQQETVNFCDVIPISAIVAGAVFTKQVYTGTRIYTYTVTCTSAGVFTLTQSNSTGTAGTLRLKLYVI